MNPKLLIKSTNQNYQHFWKFYIPPEDRIYVYTYYPLINYTELTKYPSKTYKALGYECLQVKGLLPMDEKHPNKTFKQLKQLVMLQ